MSDRKIGNNKEACKLYKAGARLEVNKKRKVATAKRAAAKRAEKVHKRLINGKPVASKHTARVNGTSRGKMPNGKHTKELVPTKPAKVFDKRIGEWVAA